MGATGGAMIKHFVSVARPHAVGTSTVLAMMDSATGRRVALKRPSAPKPSDWRGAVAVMPSWGALRDDNDEASILVSLDHEAIVSHVEHGTTLTGEPYLAMNWLEGATLEQQLRRGALDVAEAVALGHRIVSALHHAHGRGVVHRDVTPSNIILVCDDASQATLIDFGLAAAGERGARPPGTVMGTPGYMAPEQARGELEDGRAADVFALGCVLYEVLAGRRPFAGPTAVASLRSLLMEEPPRLDRLRGRTAPAALADLVARMLAKSPSERPTAHDVEGVLSALDAQDADDSGVHLRIGPLARWNGQDG